VKAVDPGIDDPRVAAYVALSGRSIVPMAEGDPAGDGLQTAEARALWAWWHRVSAGGAQPHRNDFDVIEHPQLAANLYLVEPVPGGFRLRLTGEVFQQLFSRGRGHAWMHDDAEPLARAFAGYFDFVTERKQPFRSLGRMKCAYSDWFSFESLLCPLRHDDGDQLLGVAVRLRDA
jgi:hypothetical protein